LDGPEQSGLGPTHSVLGPTACRGSGQRLSLFVLWLPARPSSAPPPPPPPRGCARPVCDRFKAPVTLGARAVFPGARIVVWLVLRLGSQDHPSRLRKRNGTALSYIMAAPGPGDALGPHSGPGGIVSSSPAAKGASPPALGLATLQASLLFFAPGGRHGRDGAVFGPGPVTVNVTCLGLRTGRGPRRPHRGLGWERGGCVLLGVNCFF